MSEIINRVASSGIITIDLEAMLPKGEYISLDIKPFLFQEIILKEKDFREHIKQTDWSTFRDKYVALFCSADAIIPTWAYMLITLELQPFAKKIVYGNLNELERQLVSEAIENLNPLDFQDARVVVKGCGDKNLGISAYVKLTEKLKPVVKSLMYGEPCSTVPLYKASKK